MKRKTSEIWCFFRAIDDTFALCNICKAKLSYKTTTTNLSKHMNRMHPSSALVQSKYKFQSKRSRGMDRNKGKPRNSAQEDVMLDFVRKHPRLLQNPTWETRRDMESLWEQMSSELNHHGPPRKNSVDWKRTLKDWKRFILKKVERNELHNLPFGTSLNSAEETIATLCRLNEDVSQIILKVSDDEMHENSSNEFDGEDVEDVVPEDESATLQTSAEYVYEPEGNKVDLDPLYLQSSKRSALSSSRVAEEETSLLEKISSNIGMVNDAANNAHLALNEFCVLYKQKLCEDRRHHMAIEQLMAEKIELKKKLLEIEQRKLSLK